MRNKNLAKLDRVKMLSYENQIIPIGFDDNFWVKVREEYLEDLRLTINILDELKHLYEKLNSDSSRQKTYGLSSQEKKAYKLVEKLIKYLDEHPKDWNNDYVYDQLSTIETV